VERAWGRVARRLLLLLLLLRHGVLEALLLPLLVVGLEAAAPLARLEAALARLEVVRAVVVHRGLELALLAVVLAVVRLATIAIIATVVVLLTCPSIAANLTPLNTIAAEIKQQSDRIDQREQIRVLRPHIHHSLPLVRPLVKLLLERDAPTLAGLAEIHYEPSVLEKLAGRVLLGVAGRLAVLEAHETKLRLHVQLGVVDLAEVTEELFEFCFGG
jgi:hypothetical protein